jgi:Flp pilus assembly protein TadD
MDEAADFAETEVGTNDLMADSTPPPDAVESRPAVLPALPGEPPQIAGEPVAGAMQESAVGGDATRDPMPSDVVATAHDTVPPPAPPASHPRGKLPAFLGGIGLGRLIGLGALGVAVCSVPLVLIAVAVSTLARSPSDPIEEQDIAAAKRADRAHSPSTAEATNVTKQRTPASAPQANATRPHSGGGIPWAVPSPKTTASCNALAGTDSEGPRGYLLQQAIERGQAEMLRGNLNGAHVAFCEAKLLGVPPASVLLSLAQVLLLQNDPETALAVVDQALQTKPDSTRAREMRGDILIRLGRVEEARNEWVRAAGAPRATPQLVTNLLRGARIDAKSAMAVGDLSRAERMLRRAVGLEPKDVDAAAQLGTVLLRTGERGAAQRWFDYAASLDKKNAHVQSLQSALGRK